jgi:hypothetical protein
MARRPLGGVLGIAIATLVVAGACGGADNEYVANTEAGLYVRLPADWTIFEVASNNPAGDPRTDPEAGPWRVVIDGSDEPSRAHLEVAAPDEPVGFVEIVPTALIQNASLSSHTALRSLLFNGESDPLDTSSGADVLDYEEIDLGHHWGNRLVAEVTAQGGEKVVVTQLAFLDSANNRVHVLRLLCTTSCYEENQDEIDEVVDSWTLEDRG